MRLEVGGAQITDAVVEVLDTLQNQYDITEIYLQALDELTRIVILDISGSGDENDTQTLSRLRALQMIRHDILALAMPPDVDDPANDAPTLSL